MNKLTKHADSDLAFPSCEISPVGLAIPENLTFEKWQQIGETLRKIEGSRLWWFGDWCNFGERKYGEKYTQALEAGDYERGTLRNAAWVASKVGISHRCDNLSWSHHREVADLDPNDQGRWLDRAGKENLPSRELRALIRAERLERDTPALPRGKYRIIYADPPWQYGDTREGLEGWEGTAAESHYPTMSIVELCALSILPIVANEAVLFIWVTSPLLAECWPVIEAWGFKYKASFVWDKKRPNFGNYNSVRHELLLICTRGSCLPDGENGVDSVQVLERMARHSEKPIEFVEIIESMYKTGRKVELFSRAKREGWDSWGNEVE